MNKPIGLIVAFLWVALISAGAQSQELPSLDHPLLEENFQVPDLTAESDRLKVHIEDLSSKYQNLLAGRQDQSLDDRLDDVFSTDNAEAFHKRYEQELAVAKANYKLVAWQKLGRHYLRRSQINNAKAVFFRIQKVTSSTKRRAEGLFFLGEAYLAAGDKAAALNLFYLSLKTSPTRNTRYRFDSLAEETDMRVKDVAVNAEKDVPSACVVFTQDLKANFDPNGYLEISPKSDIDISAQNNRICVRGLRHGGRYEIKVRPGIPSEVGPILRHEVVRAFTVPDMSERIVFASDAYVLPRSSDETVPVKTVNLSELRLQLLRINDRNLVNAIFNGTVDRNLSSGDLNEVQNTMGEKIWEGTMPVEERRNQETVTNIPLTEMLKKNEPGIYALVAEKPDQKNQRYWYQKTTQWVLISDFGLTTIKGQDGLFVMARSLETTRPLPGLELALIAKNNKILGTLNTNSKGQAKFDPGLLRGKGGNTPALLTAFRKGDYNFVKLTGPSLDLSEHAVSGRRLATELDAYLYAERGVYRPGETVFMSALVRDAKARGQGDLPVTFLVSRPDGTEMSRLTLTGDAFGGYQFEIPINGAARSGRWHVSAILDDDEQTIGNASFQVEDFVPQRIKARLTSERIYASPGDAFDVEIESLFLYGAPAAGLRGDVGISVQRDPKPFEGYESYAFGLTQEEFYGDAIGEQTFTTDEEGKAPVTITLDNVPESTFPLRLELLASVYDVSGRPVYAGWAVPMRSRPVEIGLRRDSEKSFAENEDAGFEVVALNGFGKPVAGRALSYEWIKEEYDYAWYQQGGSWRTRTTIYDESLSSGEVKTGKDGLLKLARNMRQGRYRLEVRDKDGTAMSSQRFFIGWWSSGDQPNAPDQLELIVDDADLKSGDFLSGDKVKAFIKAPFAGTAFVSVLGDGVLWTNSYDLPAEGREIEIKAKADWAPGVYLMVSAYRPQAATPSKLPIRAMGFKWLSVDRDQREVKVEIDVPETVLPRQTVSLPVQVTSSGKPQTLRMTIAAVDEGILQLTNHASPNPSDYYLSQRALGQEIRDLYGRLIKPQDGARGNLRTGGDRAGMIMADKFAPMSEAKRAEENARGTTTRTVKTVALYTKDVEVDAEGKGMLTLDLPDFNGRLRLMAVAYGASLVGQGESDLVVRDPVVADLLLPRFLAPGDRAEASLSIHNLSDGAKDITYSVETSSGVTVLENANDKVSVKKSKNVTITLPIDASGIGDAKVTLRVSAKGMSDITREWDIAVRPAQPYVSDRSSSHIEPGESYQAADFLTAYYNGTGKVNFTLASRPEFDVPDLLESLDRYPYGCTEQTVSRALPLLYLGDVAREWDTSLDELSLARRVDHAISRALARQTYDGSFSTWTATGKTQIWLSAYTVDFLTRAQEKGHQVPEAAFKHAVGWLKTRVANPNNGQGFEQTYAFYVLARLGEVRGSEVRYYAETRGGKIQTRLGLGHLAAALAILGERKYAEDFFGKAIDKRRPINTYIPDYGSDMRDAAAIVALIAETLPNGKRSLELAEALEKQYLERQYLSTQEQAWILIATHALSTSSGAQMTFSVDGKSHGPQSEAYRWQLTKIDQILDVSNDGDAPIRFIQTARGVPTETLEPVEAGFEIERTYFTTDGKLVDVSAVKQHDLMVVLIEGKALTQTKHEALLVDLLPSGFEIENSALAGDTNGQGDAKQFKFLPDLSRAEYQTARDDRYVAAINLLGARRDFAIAYLVRAVTPGTFVHPAVFVEDMYKPDYHARGPLSEITIAK